jgi:predicted small metal-binding protein
LNERLPVQSHVVFYDGGNFPQTFSILRFRKRITMLKFACKDVGVECDFVATGATAEEVKEKAFSHAGVVHADLIKNLDKDGLAKLTAAVEASIKPA